MSKPWLKPNQFETLKKLDYFQRLNKFEKKKFAFTYELKYNYYLFLYSERWYQRSCALVRHEQHQQFSRSFKQPPSPLYVYGFLHSFFKSFLIQCSRIWSKTPKNLGFGTRIDHFHNHFGIRIIDFFPPSNKLALESSCVTYNDGDGRFGQALWLCFFFIIGEDSKGWPPAGKDLLLRFGCSLWLDRRRLVADYVLETPRNTQCCCSAEHMCRSRRGKTDC